MSTILAFETSGVTCSVAVWRSGATLAVRRYRHEMHLSERLFDDIDAILMEAGIPYDNVDVIAVGLGPGSLTGTRIGVMTAKTLAATSGKRLVGVGSLDALNRAQADYGGDLVVTTIPHRADLLYAAAYLAGSDQIAASIAPAVYTIAQLAGRLQESGNSFALICGPSAPLLERLAADTRTADFDIIVSQPSDPSAVDVATLAEARLMAGVPAVDPFALVPLYLSEPAITLPRNPISKLVKGVAEAPGES